MLEKIKEEKYEEEALSALNSAEEVLQLGDT